MEGESVEEASSLPTSRKLSISDALNKFTAGTFTRRRTTTNTTISTTSTSTGSTSSRSLLPTPSGIPRSSSFFGSLTALVPRSVSGAKDNSAQATDAKTTAQAKITKASLRTSAQTARTSTVDQHISQVKDAPSQAGARDGRRRNTLIPHRALLQPLEPPLPRSSTVGNLEAKVTASTPGFMRSTSSSAARRTSIVAPRKSISSNPAKVPALPCQSASTRPSTTAGDSLLSSEPAKVAAENNEKGRVPTKPLSEPGVETRPKSMHSMQSLSQGSFVNLEGSMLVSPPLIQDDDKIPAGKPDLLAQSTSISLVPQTGKGDLTTSESDLSPTLYIADAKPPTYWLGLFVAVSDRFRTEALLPLHSSSTKTIITSSSHDMNDDYQRAAHVFTYLKSICVSKEAEQSLEQFRKLWEAKGGVADEGKKIKEKRGVFEKLMGKKVHEQEKDE